MNPLRFTKLIMVRHAQSPLKKAANAAANKAVTETDASIAGSSMRSITSSAVAPRIGGRTIKKLNRAASLRSMPKSNAAEMVAPLRLMPGNTATA